MEIQVTLITRKGHAGEQTYEDMVVASYEEAAYLASWADNPDGCDCCRPAVRGVTPEGRVLKADPGGYWIACRHGRWACPECGDPSLPYPDDYAGEFGPIVPDSEYRQVARPADWRPDDSRRS